MSKGTRNSIRTIKFWGRPKQEGRPLSFHHTLDCKRKVLAAIGVDLPMSIKTTSTVLQPRPPAKMIPISVKLALKPTMITANTSVPSCYHGQARQLLFHQGKMSEWGPISENLIRYLNVPAPWSYPYKPPELATAHQWPSVRYFVTDYQKNRGSQIEHIICHVQKGLNWLSRILLGTCLLYMDRSF